jgi:rhamnose transport system permease protein
MLNRLASFARSWDAVLLALIVIALAAGALLSPYFLTVDNLLSQTRDLMVIGFLALGLAPIVILGEMDLSGEANLGVCAVALGLLYEAHLNIWAGSVLVIVLGGLIGALNGAVIILLRLPSLIVTLATLISLRGLAFVALENRPIAGFPDPFVAFGNNGVGATAIPQSLIAFVVVAAPLWCLLNLSVLGRWIYAIGLGPNTARFSGVPVDWVKFGMFAFSGLMAGCGAVVLAAHYDSVRADAAQGDVLAVLTVVLLGGISIFGGSGNLGAVALSLILIGLIQNAMRLANLGAEAQALVIGLLLILSVVVPRLLFSLGRRDGEKRAFMT